MESTLLKNYSDQEKGAYFGAIASLATADHSASDEEINFISQLADEAGISESQKQMVIRAAQEMSGDELQRCLDILKNSELRFSLVAELISFSKSDGNYDDQEKNNIEAISQELGINNTQFSLLDNFVSKTDEANGSVAAPAKEGFLESLGLGDKFKSAGMNMSGLSKGLLAIAAPMLLSRIFGGRRNNNNVSGMGGGLGSGMAGGLLGGGGIGSLLSMLSMGRGFGSTGGLLSKLFRSRV